MRRHWPWQLSLHPLPNRTDPASLIVFNTKIRPFKSSTAAVPFYPVMVIVALFVFIAFPMTVIGAIVGRRTTSDFQAPCRTTRVPRQVCPGPRTGSTGGDVG